MGSVTAVNGGRRYIEVRLISSGDFCQPGSGSGDGAAGGGEAALENGSGVSVLPPSNGDNQEERLDTASLHPVPTPVTEALPEQSPPPGTQTRPPVPAHRQVPPRVKKQNKKQPSATAAQGCAAVREDRSPDMTPAGGSSPGTAVSEGAGGGVPGGDGRGGGGVAEVGFGASNGPRFLSRTRPNYPSIARRLGKEGTVVLRVTIDERGRATQVELLKGAGSGFDEEAVDAVRNSTYVPATRNGKPVTCRAILPVRFVLKDPG